MSSTEIKGSIENLREHVDIIDNKILELIKERITVAQAMGELKRNAGLPLRDVARENSIIERLTAENQRTYPKLSEHELHHLFRNLMQLCLKAQE